MEFAAYLVKPIDKGQLDALVERLPTRNQYTDRLLEFNALALKKAILDAGPTEQECTASNEYAQLEVQLDTVRQQTDEALEDVFRQDEFPEVGDPALNVDIEGADSLSN